MAPDGRSLVFTVVRPDGTRQIALRRLEDLEARALPGTEGTTGPPFWAPDSRAFGFFADGRLKVFTLGGDRVKDIAPFEERFTVTAGAWNADGVILFSRAGAGLLRTRSDGGPPAQATVLADGETQHTSPVFLPDGRRFLLVSQPSRAVRIGTLDSTATTPLGDVRAERIAFSQGRLLFVDGTTLMAWRLDAETLEPQGSPVPVLEGVSTFLGVGVASAAFSVSQNGTIAVSSGGVQPTRPVWFDRAGARLGVAGEAAQYRQFALAPDGRTAAMNQFVGGGELRIWLLDLVRGVTRPFTLDRAGDPVWSPDGRAIVFGTGGGGGIVRKSVDDGSEQVLWRREGAAAPRYPESWSLDGRRLAFMELEGVGVLDLTAGGTASTWLPTAFDRDEPHFSPDGRWMAYQSDESGRTEMYVQAYPGPGQPIRVSTTGGGAARWRGDGRELCYLTQEGVLMSVSVTAGTPLQLGVPKALFRTPIADVQLSIDQYDVTANGQRFLVLEPSGTDDTSRVTVVVNGLRPAAAR